MNRTTQMMAAILMMIFVASFSSCKKNEEKKDTTNTFSCDGETYRVLGGLQLFDGRSPANSNAVEVVLVGEEYSLIFSLFVPTSNKSLVAHNYQQNTNRAAYTVKSGMVVILDEEWEAELLYDIDNINIDVSVSSDSTYTINISGTVDGSPLTGNYTGALQWIDNTVSAAPGNAFNHHGESYAISQAAQMYMGSTPANTSGVALFFSDGYNEFMLIFFVPSNKDRLVAHSYAQNTNGAAYTTLEGSVGVDEGDGYEEQYAIDDVAVTVAQSGNIYTIDVSGSAGGSPFACHYAGELNWVDGSDEIWEWTAQSKSKARQPIFERLERRINAGQ